jgi:hypothetical protein
VERAIPAGSIPLIGMAHHKRKRPKQRRTGCLLCKPYKLPAIAKADRRRSNSAALANERAAW